MHNNEAAGINCETNKLDKDKTNTTTEITSYLHKSKVMLNPADDGMNAGLDVREKQLLHCFPSVAHSK